MARVALDRLGDHETATIRLHPDDYALVNASPDRTWASDQVTIVADSSVERGGCLVQCDAGLMKVGLESQFNELARTLLGEHAGDLADRAEARHGTAASPDGISLDPYLHALQRADLTPLSGRVVRVVGLLIESVGPRARVGEVCEIISASGEPPLVVEVVGFREGYLQSVPLGVTAGIRPGDRIVSRGSLASVPAGDAVLGRVIDPFGRPLDDLGPLRTPTSTPLQRPPVNPLAREPIVGAD